MTPRKGPQEWEDIPIPGLDIAAPPVRTKRKESAKDKADALVPKWQRYAPNTARCDDCTDLRISFGTGGIRFASYIRRLGDEVRYLCYLHTNEWRHRDDLAERNART